MKINILNTILILIVILLSFCLINKKIEFFDNLCNSLNSYKNDIFKFDNKFGHKKVLVDNTNNFSNTDNKNINKILGPNCLKTCIMDNVPKINFTHNYDKITRNNKLENVSHCYNSPKNILKYNYDKLYPNSNDESHLGDPYGFCFKYNSNIFPYYISDTDKCSKQQNCKIIKVNDGEKCIENNLNFSSYGSILNESNCKKCVNKYYNNINNLKNKLNTIVKQEKKCV